MPEEGSKSAFQLKFANQINGARQMEKRQETRCARDKNVVANRETAQLLWSAGAGFLYKMKNAALSVNKSPNQKAICRLL